MFRPHRYISTLLLITSACGSGAKHCYGQTRATHDGVQNATREVTAEEIAAGFAVDAEPSLNRPANDQPGLAPEPEREFDWKEFSRLVEQCSGTRTLLERLETLHRTDQLRQLGNGNLPFSLIPISGWRWEVTTRRGGRVVLAVDGPLLVVIRENRRVEMSVKDIAGGKAVARGFAGSSQYFAHVGGATQHVGAMNATHFSDAQPRLFPIYFYFAGPTKSVHTMNSLPRSQVDLISR